MKKDTIVVMQKLNLNKRKVAAKVKTSEEELFSYPAEENIENDTPGTKDVKQFATK